MLGLLLYNCFENLGTLEIEEFKDFIKSLNEEKRNYLNLELELVKFFSYPIL